MQFASFQFPAKEVLVTKSKAFFLSDIKIQMFFLKYFLFIQFEAELKTRSTLYFNLAKILSYEKLAYEKTLQLHKIPNEDVFLESKLFVYNSFICGCIFSKISTDLHEKRFCISARHSFNYLSRFQVLKPFIAKNNFSRSILEYNSRNSKDMTFILRRRLLYLTCNISAKFQLDILSNLQNRTPPTRKRNTTKWCTKHCSEIH